MKLLISISCVLMMFLSQYAMAEEHPFVPYIAHVLSIKLSNDRTGIVKNVRCIGCDYTNAIITPKTKAYKNGQQVDLLEARKRAGKTALVSFNPKTREVQTIRWYEYK